MYIYICIYAYHSQVLWPGNTTAEGAFITAVLYPSDDDDNDDDDNDDDDNVNDDDDNDENDNDDDNGDVDDVYLEHITTRVSHNLILHKNADQAKA
jgi:hypothetical protein